MKNAFFMVGTIVAGMGGMGGMALMLRAIFSRRTVNVAAEVSLSDEARRWVDEFQESARSAQEDAKEARKEAREARSESAAAHREAAEAHIQIQRVRWQAQRLIDHLQAVYAAIRAPDATVDGLRTFVAERQIPDNIDNWGGR